MTKCKVNGIFWLLFACHLFLLSNAYGEQGEYIRIESYGLAFVTDGNTAQARDEALKDGFKRAVESAIKEGGFKIDIKREGILKDRILGNTDAYIANYRIISEEITEEKIEGEERPLLVYSISIEVNIELNVLKNDLIRFELIRDDTGELKKIHITLIDVFEYKDFVRLRDAIKGLKGVKELSYKTFSRGRIVVTIESIADITTIKEGLLLKDFSDFKVEINEKGGDALDLIIKKESN